MLSDEDKKFVESRKKLPMSPLEKGICVLVAIALILLLATVVRISQGGL
jgi:hypothetical protein